MNNYPLTQIATVYSPYKEKFGTPRQSGLTSSVQAKIVFSPEFATAEALRGLDEYSHIWLLFIFHHNCQKGWQPTVRPPRLGGNKRVGVYASRSPFRPNPIGLSAVKLLQVNCQGGELSLQVEGADLIDGTPIIDIKPYIEYADSFPDAISGFAQQAPEQLLSVEYSPLAQAQLQTLEIKAPNLDAIIRETLSLDPRPAYRRQNTDEREYGVDLDGYNILWRVETDKIVVTAIETPDKGW